MPNTSVPCSLINSFSISCFSQYLTASFIPFFILPSSFSYARAFASTRNGARHQIRPKDLTQRRKGIFKERVTRSGCSLSLPLHFLLFTANTTPPAIKTAPPIIANHAQSGMPLVFALFWAAS